MCSNVRGSQAEKSRSGPLKASKLLLGRSDRSGRPRALFAEGSESRNSIRRKPMNSGTQATPPREVLTLREVASILRCSKTHVSNAVNGKVPGLPRLTHVAIGRRILIRKEWLDEWMETNKRKC
jgi:excisionase family DNA binding protein